MSSRCLKFLLFLLFCNLPCGISSRNDDSDTSSSSSEESETSPPSARRNSLPRYHKFASSEGGRRRLTPVSEIRDTAAAADRRLDLHKQVYVFVDPDDTKLPSKLPIPPLHKHKFRDKGQERTPVRTKPAHREEVKRHRQPPPSRRKKRRKNRARQPHLRRDDPVHRDRKRIHDAADEEEPTSESSSSSSSTTEELDIDDNEDDDPPDPVGPRMKDLKTEGAETRSQRGCGSQCHEGFQGTVEYVDGYFDGGRLVPQAEPFRRPFFAEPAPPPPPLPPPPSPYTDELIDDELIDDPTLDVHYHGLPSPQPHVETGYQYHYDEHDFHQPFGAIQSGHRPSFSLNGHGGPIHPGIHGHIGHGGPFHAGGAGFAGPFNYVGEGYPLNQAYKHKYGINLAAVMNYGARVFRPPKRDYCQALNGNRYAHGETWTERGCVKSTCRRTPSSMTVIAVRCSSSPYGNDCPNEDDGQVPYPYCCPSFGCGRGYRDELLHVPSSSAARGRLASEEDNKQRRSPQEPKINSIYDGHVYFINGTIYGRR